VEILVKTPASTGHLWAEDRMGRNYLAHHVNAVLAAAGFKWLELLLSRFLAAQKQRPPFNGSENRKLHGRLMNRDR
jgi:hypothetical protein